MNDEDKELLLKLALAVAGLLLLAILVIGASYAEAYIWLTMYKKIILGQ